MCIRKEVKLGRKKAGAGGEKKRGRGEKKKRGRGRGEKKRRGPFGSVGLDSEKKLSKKRGPIWECGPGQ